MISGKDILFRSHNFHSLLTDGKGVKLTDIQAAELVRLLAIDSPTDKQRKTIAELIAKRDVKPELGDTGKGLIDDIFNEVIRGTYKQSIETPQMYKGTTMELHALQRAARVNGWGFVMKYTGKELRDNIGTGMPDETRIGIDAKCSHTDKQFMKVFDVETLENKVYETQAKRYAQMLERDHWYIAYSLENSPEETVIADAWKLWKKSEGEGTPTESFIDDVRGLHIFDHLPDLMMYEGYIYSTIYPIGLV
jgi:hypothetical protein